MEWYTNSISCLFLEHHLFQDRHQVTSLYLQEISQYTSCVKTLTSKNKKLSQCIVVFFSTCKALTIYQLPFPGTPSFPVSAASGDFALPHIKIHKLHEDILHLTCSHKQAIYISSKALTDCQPFPGTPPFPETASGDSA